MAKHLDQVKLMSCLVRSYHQWYYELLEECDAEYHKPAIRDALDGKNARLFKTLIGAFKYVGGSDYVNQKIWQEMNPKPTYYRLKREIKTAKCSKLATFDQFNNCGYKKNTSCNEPQFFKRCQLPKYNMRNGKLNQMVFSVYLFLRDSCEGDFIGFVKGRIGSPQQIAGIEEKELSKTAENLVIELDRIFNVGLKLSNMVMSGLFYSRVGRWNYRRLHPHMVAVDTLVHAFLERTGTLKRFKKDHSYGEKRCHSKGGCIEVINEIARRIDCKRFNDEYPSYYPRMVQACIWKFCTDNCNKIKCKINKLDDKCEFVEWCKEYSSQKTDNQ